MSTPSTLLATATPRTIRRRILDLAETDLLGPAGGDTELVDELSLRDRYLVGVLAPRGTYADPGEDDDMGAGDHDDVEEVGDALAAAPASLMPSSIGMTFRCDPSTDQLRVRASWGRYSREPHPERDTGRVWRRAPAGGDVTLPLAAGSVSLGSFDPEQPGVTGDARVRGGGSAPWTVTVFLRNEQHEPEQSPDSAWLFQVSLEVQHEDGHAIFVGQADVAIDDDPEQHALALSYRNRCSFAVGHGVAVEPQLEEQEPRRALRLATRSLPAIELAQMLPPTAADGEDEPMRILADTELDMRTLAATDGDLPSLLRPLATAYAKWLDNAETKSDADTELDHDAAREVINRGRAAAVRISDAIDLVERDAEVREAFRFAMRTMADQRIRSIYARSRRRGEDAAIEDFDRPEHRSWRPFQLAFILLNLRSLAEPDSPERSDPANAVVDLLWFPTGGGKTEAYLGLTAFALAIRRLRPNIGGLDGSAGLVVLMRYTLRVLTLQQFQRAAALLCACEIQRQEHVERWGSEPFRIGLWVGASTTPNSIDRADEAIAAARRKEQYNRGTPHQLPNCPWCGSEIDPGRNIRVSPFDTGTARVLTYCSDDACEFSERNASGEGLPLVTVDEEIYRRLPSVLIATVDKFARLPWVGETQALFGVVDRWCPRHGHLTPSISPPCGGHHNARGSLPAVTVEPATRRLRPPDLVIQDELHLIAGPLGSLVGLYETAVDQLASWELNGVAVRPKVVASTATIRQADVQAHALYLRRLAVFPPPSLDAEDSFFARERAIGDETPGRLYVGVCAPGRRLKAVLIRVYVALLAAAQKTYEEYGEAADPWLTLVGYFTSIRELAGMRRLCDDDVRTRTWDMDSRGLARRELRSYNIEELTSRLNASKLPATLDRVEQPFPDPSVARKDHDGIDVLLATNMISVGVDIERLGLMVVAGQPKTTSEYIQASSRVGRSAAGPGLVVTVYNWSRPRDLSHYERFFHDHRTAYAQVEPLTVTPFASRARDRGLAAVLASLVRLADPQFDANDGARLVVRDDPAVQRAVAAIIGRAAGVTAEEAVATAVRDELARALDEWQARIDRGKQTGAPLVYQADDATALLHPLEKASDGTVFNCANSLRDVEPSVGLLLQEGKAS